MDYENLSNPDFFAFEDRLEACLAELARSDPRSLRPKLKELEIWVDSSWKVRYVNISSDEELAKYLRKGK